MQDSSAFELIATTANKAPRYDLGAFLGAGGMGEVFVARDRELGREVALKRLCSPVPRADELARFQREVRIQAMLDHPAIVPVYEVRRDAGGNPYFTMRRLTGRTLDLVLDENTPIGSMVRVLSDVSVAIAYAHTRGVVHRDIKPGNIMLGDHGEVHIIDWGIARLVAAATDDATLQTCAGALIGTPGYLAPEQAIDARSVDGKADVYALGSILFEILSGQPLHPPEPRDALRSTLAGPDGSPARRRPDRDIPPELDLLCFEALALDPRQRPTARGFADRIRAFTDGDRDLARRHRLASEHLALARQADHAGDPARTLREAGRALALDPCCTPAADLLTRLMLQPRLAASTLNLREQHGAPAAIVAAILFATILLMTFIAACGGLLGAAVSSAIVLGTTLLFVAAWSSYAKPNDP